MALSLFSLFSPVEVFKLDNLLRIFVTSILSLSGTRLDLGVELDSTLNGLTDGVPPKGGVPMGCMAFLHSSHCSLETCNWAKISSGTDLFQTASATILAENFARKLAHWLARQHKTEHSFNSLESVLALGHNDCSGSK